MNFNITIDQEPYTLEVSDALLDEFQEVIKDLDADYDRGFQLGRYWIESPSDEERCQLVANQVVNALHQDDVRQFYIMSAYLFSKFPTLKMVSLNSDLEVNEIEILD